MNEAMWFTGADVYQMLEFLRTKRSASRTKVGRRRLRLFCCACARRVWDQLNDTYRALVEGVEKEVEGKLSREERERLAEAALARWRQEMMQPGLQGSGVIWSVANSRYPAQMAMSAAGVVANALAEQARVERSGAGDLPHQVGAAMQQAFQSEARHQTSLLREIFGNPFDPLPKRKFPAELRGLAEACAEDPTQCCVLADALTDLGEEDAAAHCRRPEHVRGCHIVDWVRGLV